MDDAEIERLMEEAFESEDSADAPLYLPDTLRTIVVDDVEALTAGSFGVRIVTSTVAFDPRTNRIRRHVLEQIQMSASLAEQLGHALIAASKKAEHARTNDILGIDDE